MNLRNLARTYGLDEDTVTAGWSLIATLSIAYKPRRGGGPRGATGPGGSRNPCGGAVSRGAENGIRVSPKGYELVENHVRSFGHHPPNEAMLSRLRQARDANKRVFNGDANFFLHEAAEATMYKKKGWGWDKAHPAALQKYGVNDFTVYSTEVINEFSGYFSQGFKDFWQ